MKRILFATLAAALFGCFAASAGAAILTINATVQGTIKDSDGAPIGVFDVLQPAGEPAGVPSVERNLVGLGNPHERRGILEFDLSGLPSGAVVNQALLSLGESVDQPAIVRLFGYAGNGLLNFGDEAAGVVVQADISDGVVSALISFTVTPFVQSLVTNGDQWAGFNIRDLSDALDGRYAYITDPQFGLQEALTIVFTVVQVPEPATLALLGLGLAGLGFARARRREEAKSGR